MWRASWSRLARDVRGLSTVEYTVLLVLIVTAAVGIWKRFGTALTTQLEKSTTEFEGLSGDTPPAQGN
jgi:Flp pilus assembly pilin Flp